MRLQAAWKEIDIAATWLLQLIVAAYLRNIQACSERDQHLLVVHEFDAGNVAVVSLVL